MADTLARLPLQRKPANDRQQFNQAYMKSLKERMNELKDTTGWSVSQIAGTAKVSSSAVSQWLGHGKKEIRSIGNIAAAMRLEKASGYRALWLAQGNGPKMVEMPAGGPDAGDPLLAALTVVAEAIEPASRTAKLALVPLFTDLVEKPSEVRNIAQTMHHLLGTKSGVSTSSYSVVQATSQTGEDLPAFTPRRNDKRSSVRKKTTKE